MGNSSLLSFSPYSAFVQFKVDHNFSNYKNLCGPLWYWFRSWEFEGLNFEKSSHTNDCLLHVIRRDSSLLCCKKSHLYFKSLLCACNCCNDIGTTPASFGSVVLCVSARKCKSCVWVMALEYEALLSGIQEAGSVTSISFLSPLLFCCVS